MSTQTLETGAEIPAAHLTELETNALRVLFADAIGNGHDFGMTNALAESRIMRDDQIGGVVSSLVKKDIVSVWGSMGDSAFVQFTWGKRCGNGPESWDKMPESFAEFCDTFAIIPA
jgi:hypothetical protein